MGGNSNARLEARDMSYEIDKIDPSLGFGAIVRGLTEDQLADQAIRVSLKRHWIERGLLIFRDCDISASFQVELSGVFGKLEPHAVKEIWVEGHPELITLKYEPGD